MPHRRQPAHECHNSSKDNRSTFEVPSSPMTAPWWRRPSCWAASWDYDAAPSVCTSWCYEADQIPLAAATGCRIAAWGGTASAPAGVGTGWQSQTRGRSRCQSLHQFRHQSWSWTSDDRLFPGCTGRCWRHLVCGQSAHGAWGKTRDLRPFLNRHV